MKLIDADALKDKKTINTSNTGGNNSLHYYSYEDVQNAPTIDAEPVQHGYWIKESDYCEFVDFDILKYTCSKCGWVKRTDTTGIKYNYCPSCGAKMDEITEAKQP